MPWLGFQGAHGGCEVCIVICTCRRTAFSTVGMNTVVLKASKQDGIEFVLPCYTLYPRYKHTYIDVV